MCIIFLFTELNLIQMTFYSQLLYFGLSEGLDIADADKKRYGLTVQCEDGCQWRNSMTQSNPSLLRCRVRAVACQSTRRRLVRLSAPQSTKDKAVERGSVQQKAKTQAWRLWYNKKLEATETDSCITSHRLHFGQKSSKKPEHSVPAGVSRAEQRRKMQKC